MKIKEPVSVSFIYDSDKNKVYPKKLFWKGRLYSVRQVGLHHVFKKGSTLFHVFSVSSESLFFRLILDTKNLSWKIEEISNGF